MTLRKNLNGEIEKHSTMEILTYVSNEFSKSDADFVQIIDNCVLVKNKVFMFKIRRGGSTNRWGGISGAKFQIIEQGNIRKAFYSIDLTRILIVGLILGLIFGLSIGSTWIGIFALIIFGTLLNCLIKVIQHLVIFSDILDDW